jgi:hypothetical protein
MWYGMAMANVSAGCGQPFALHWTRETPLSRWRVAQRTWVVVAWAFGLFVSIDAAGVAAQPADRARI